MTASMDQRLAAAFKRSNERRRDALNRSRENAQIAKSVRMHVSPWFRDELGNPSRVVRCAE